MGTNNEDKLLLHLASHNKGLKELTTLLEQADTDDELINDLIAGLSHLIKCNDDIIAEILSYDDLSEFRIDLSLI